MNDKNTLTIFVTTYNRDYYLKDMLKSIQNQSYKKFKVIVLDNCSRDNTEQIVKGFLQDERFSYIRHKSNIGGIENINYAFQNCNTDFFCILHDDDILCADMIEKELEYLKLNRQCCAVTCRTSIINEDGEQTKKEKAFSKEKEFSKNVFFTNYIHNQKHLVFPTTMYRNSFIRENKLKLNAEVGPCADVVLYMEMERYGGTIVELPDICFNYRVYDNQDSSTNFENMLLMLMRYLCDNTYYAGLLEEDIKGKSAYLKWYEKKLAIRTAANRITSEYALKSIEEMQRILRITRHTIFYFIIILASKYPHSFKKMYDIAKGSNK